MQMLLLVSLAGLGAFLVSAGLLHGGLGSMAARYFFAAATGYLFFLVLVRLWLAYQRRQWSRDGDVPIESGDGAGSVEPEFSGEGGAFGGGGASGSYSDELPVELDALPSVTSESSSGFLDAVPDVDDAWPLVLALVALVAGAVALGFVVYASPLLFAEVLLDAAVVSAVYRRARRRNRGHWLHGVLKRTWLPAAALCLSVALGGFVLQLLAPEAKSLGGVFRQWL